MPRRPDKRNVRKGPTPRACSESKDFFLGFGVQGLGIKGLGSKDFFKGFGVPSKGFYTESVKAPGLGA